MMGKPYWRE